MEIRLGTVKNSEMQSEIVFDKALTNEQYQDFLNAISEIHALESNKRLFEITFLNKNDFVDTFNRDFKEMLKSISISGDNKIYYKYHLNFNRLFLNYLSSIKSFVDHNDTTIKRKFGSDSKEAQQFIEITRNGFDNFFCYRFFFKLRDYSQHCGLPLSQFGLSTERTATGQYIASAEMSFDPLDLLGKFSGWGKIVKSDLEKMSGKFPLAPLIEEMTQVLINFWQSVDLLNANSVNSAVKFIKLNVNHLRADNTDICIFTDITDNADGSLKNFGSLRIPLEIIDDWESN